MTSRYKQVLLIRRDLGMRRGKEISQGAHASMKVVLQNMEHPDVKAWLGQAFTKIALVVESDTELLNLCQKATDVGIINATIIDSGRTEFKGVPTLTVAAIGPGEESKIDEITGHLRLR